MDDNKAFERIYRQYAPIVFHYLQSIGCPPEDAEDITHDTFVKALLHIDSYRGSCKLSVWLCQIAKNTWNSHLKRARRSITAPPPERGAPDEQLWQWLDLLEDIEEPGRGLFLKKALGGWNYEELSRQYGKSESWARVTYHRVRLRLQKLLHERGN